MACLSLAAGQAYQATSSLGKLQDTRVICNGLCKKLSKTPDDNLSGPLPSFKQRCGISRVEVEDHGAPEERHNTESQ